MITFLQNKIANLQFWWAKRNCRLNKHYTFMLDVSDTNAIAIKILKKFPDTIVEFSDFRIKEDGLFEFNTNVIANPNLHDTESKKFIRFTQDIVRSIILESIQNARSLNENRKSGFVEFDSEREVHEEGSTILEDRIPERKPRKKTVRRNKAIRSGVQHTSVDSGSGDQSKEIN